MAVDADMLVSVFFSYAFRPLFLLATLYALVVVPLWVAAWLGHLPMPASLGTPIWWHAHEMIFGFAGAAIGGFALTAVATWTKRAPVSGAPLIALSALWLIARLLFFAPSSALLVPAVAADLGYGILLLVLMSREVVSARNTRNHKVLVLLALLPIANLAFFFGLRSNATWTMSALFSGMWVVLLLINLIGGRIIPGFTRNWLKRRADLETRSTPKLPPAFDRFDLLVTWLMVALAALQVLEAPAIWIALVGLSTGVLMFGRLARWQGLRGAAEPLVWVLHLGFAWLPVGFVLLGLSALDLAPRTAGIHAMTSGAITTMILAVASRAALGHTGRQLESHPLLTASYLLITIAAIARVAATFGLGPRGLLATSAIAWFFAFACFAWSYIPILTRPRLQRKGSLPVV